MPERDPSELDLAAAFRAYLEEAPTEVRPTELARHFATAYPHRRAAMGPWQLRLTPAMAWLLVLAGLLLALVTGMLVVGSPLQRKLPAVVPPDGETFVCPPGSTPDEPGPVDQARPPYELAMAFDRRAGRLLALAQIDNGLQTWTFDVCTNTWTRMHPNQEPPRTTRQLVYDVDSDVTIASDGTRMWAYDYEANTSCSAPTDHSRGRSSRLRARPSSSPSAARSRSCGPVSPTARCLSSAPWEARSTTSWGVCGRSSRRLGRHHREIVPRSACSCGSRRRRSWSTSFAR